MVDAPVLVAEPPTPAPDVIEKPLRVAGRRGSSNPSLRRYVIAVLIGIGAVAIPYVWVLWDLWTQSPDPLRNVDPSNFYDLQARAMFAGHLYLANGALGIEEFDHAGHAYTYFGIFPSLIRMPILAVTSRFDRELTAPSMLAAWSFTAMFVSLLFWRARIMVRGAVEMGRAEAASFGVLTATIMGGSVLLVIAQNPWVYNEDFAWSVALTTGSLFALLGLIERPSWKRVGLVGLLVLATSLNRTPAGYACVIGTFLVAGWFAVGRGGKEARRWSVPLVSAGLIAFLANCAVTYAKFGLPVGLPMADQVWAHVNAHRRLFLSANHGKAFNLAFLPSTLWAYFNPGGLHLSGVFPFAAMPSTPARAVGNVVLDQTYATSSIPTSMPMLFLLSIWGTIAAFRRRPPGQLGAIRLLILTAAAVSAGVLVWGYIAESYLSDFMPFLILAGGIGMIDIWRRLEGRSRNARAWALAAIAIGGAFSVFANSALAASPTPEWSSTQLQSFVQRQDSISSGALASTVIRADTLPYYAPAGTIYDIANCSGLYRSTGVSYSDVPGQQIQHLTWAPIEQGPGINHTIDVRSSLVPGTMTRPITLLTFGSSTLVLAPAGGKMVELRMLNAGAPSVTWPSSVGWKFPLLRNRTYRFFVMTDPHMHSVQVKWGSFFMIGHYLAGDGPAVVHASDAAGGLPVSVTDATPANPTIGLCRALSSSQ